MAIFITTYSYIKLGFIKLYAKLKLLSLFVSVLLLSGCLGGTVAQQIARSIATSIADKTVANAMDVNDNIEPIPNRSVTLQNRAPSELSLALMTTSFRSNHEQAPTQQTIEKPIHILKASTLVRVKLYNLIIGDERKAIYEQAHTIGTLNLPSQQEWAKWFVAAGIREDNQKQIIYLIPPQLGKLTSGSYTIVEIANTGDLNIARYSADEHKVYQAMDQSSHSALQ
jgi:hypothetical protein